MPSFWEKWLPVILGGGAVAGQVLGTKAAVGSSDRAADLQYKSGQEQLNALLGMYGLERGDRAPARAVGLNALNTLQNWKPGGPNPMAKVDFSQFKPNTIDLPPQLSRLTTGGGNALVGNGTPTFSDLPTSGIHGRPSGVAGRAATGAGLGATIGSVVPGVGTAVGAGAGALYGGIAGLLDNNNADKDFASQGINRVSEWTWNTLMPSVRNGQIAPDDAERQFNQVFSSWENSMRNTPGFNSGVLQRSIDSQRGYFQPFFDEINRLKQTART